MPVPNSIYNCKLKFTTVKHNLLLCIAICVSYYFNMLTVNERLKEIRMQRGLTQKQLASFTGLSPSEVCAVEKRMRSPQTDTIQRIAAALEVSVSFLLGEFYSDLPLEKALARDSLDIFLRRENLPEERQRVLRGICNTPSAPQTVKGWQDLLQNLLIYETLKGQNVENRTIEFAPLP